jgi:transcriptional regulator with XRE-family HTH domain
MAGKSPNFIDVAVGRSVRVWRMATGMSQAQLASRLGVTFQQIQKYEVGADRIGTGRLVKVGTILGVPIAALFDGTEAGHQGLNVSEFRQAAGLCSNGRNLPVP